MPTTRDLLKTIKYFANLAPVPLERTEAALVMLAFQRGETLFMEGEPCKGLYIVQAGRVRIYKTSPEGREQVLLVAEPGDTFNEVPVFDGGPNPATAEALEDSVLHLLPRKDLLALIEEYPALARGFVQVFAARLRHLTALVEDLSFRSVTSRVAKILLQQGREASLQITQQELAAMAGTAREVVGRALKALEERGAIRLERGRILVLDRRALAEAI